MQQNYQIIKANHVNSQPATLGQTVNIMIGKGTYSCNQSKIEVNHFCIGLEPQNNIYVRSDCCPVVQSHCTVTIDGQERAKYVNLTQSQLAYFQEFIHDEDIILDCDNGSSQQISKKQWQCMGDGVNITNPQTIQQTYELSHFLPGLFPRHQKYFEVQNQMLVQIQIGRLNGCIALQSNNTDLELTGDADLVTGIVTFDPAQIYIGGNTSPLFNVINDGNNTKDTTSVKFEIILKQYVNVQNIEQPLYFYRQDMYQQQCNPIIDLINKRSEWQSISIVPNGVNDQFNIEDIVDDKLGKYSITKNNYQIVQANSTRSAINQFTMSSDEPKRPCQNLIGIWQQTFENCQVFHNIFAQNTQETLSVYIGYQYTNL